jgi:hypothetical protein
MEYGIKNHAVNRSSCKKYDKTYVIISHFLNIWIPELGKYVYIYTAYMSRWIQKETVLETIF